MPRVWIPALLRSLTNGQAEVDASGETVGEVIDYLEARFPGLRERLIEDGRLRPSLSLVVDGAVSRHRLRQRLEEGSEVHFLPVISGGTQKYSHQT